MTTDKGRSRTADEQLAAIVALLDEADDLDVQVLWLTTEIRALLSDDASSQTG